MRRNLVLLLAIASLFIGGNAFAGDVLNGERLVSPMFEPEVLEAQAIDTGAFSDAGVVDLQQLNDLRGREGGMSVTVATDQDLNAAVVGGAITADNFTTGGVSFGENAFDNFGGVGLVNVVTGNNNAVEAAIGVTFNLLD